MPTLEWIGKDKVVNHHLEVPYRVLEEQYTYNAEKSENMIIRGDNLEALKALLPRYEGKVKCIYIDPPYNTGNEGWVYNDNVNDPRIKKWLGEVVGKEGEDLSRHDKWLCMMYPRLKLLQRLLAEDGVIFISIDDTEYANLKLICDEIFGANCFVSNISWQRTYSMRNDAKGVPSEVEHVLVYSRNIDWQPQKLERTESMDSKYKNPDNDPSGSWRNIVASAPNASTHQGMVYAIQNPMTGEYTYPPQGRCWSLGQNQMLEAMCQWCEYTLADLGDYEARAKVCNIPMDEVKKDVMAIVLKDDVSTAKNKALAIYQSGPLPEFFFSRNGYGALSRKAYLQQMGGRPVTNLWPFEETGHTDEASRLLKTMFGGTAIFDTPKPPKVVCGCCGHALFRTPYKTPYYYCRYSQVSENLPCHGLRVDADELLQAVFTTLQKQMDAVAGERKDIPTALDALQNRQDEYRQQAETLQDGKRHLYEQYLLQEIDLDTYKTKKAELDARLVRLENAYDALKVQLKREQEQEGKRSIITRPGKTGDLIRGPRQEAWV